MPQQRRRVQKQRPRAQEENRQPQEETPKPQTKEIIPLPSLRERLKNTPLLDDDTLKERLQRNPNPSI